MPKDEDELPLGAFLSGRQVPDAQDLLAIREEIAVVEARIAELRTKKLAWVNGPEIKRLEQYQSMLESAQIVAREHVRSNPDQIRNLALFEQQQAAEKQANQAESPQQGQQIERLTEPSLEPSKKNSGLAWLKQEIAARKKVPTLAGEDDE